MSFSQFSTDVVYIFSSVDEFRQNYLDALELGNRVDEATLKDTVESLRSVIDSHHRLRSLIHTDIVDPTTSKANLVLLALKSLTQMVRNDVVAEGTRFLGYFQDCYNNYVHYLIQSISSQLTFCTQEFSKMQMISEMYPFIDEDSYEYLNTSVEKMIFLQRILTSAANALNLASAQGYCPVSCLEMSCSSELQSFNSQVFNFSNIAGIVFRGLEILQKARSQYSLTSSQDYPAYTESFPSASSTSPPTPYQASTKPVSKSTTKFLSTPTFVPTEEAHPTWMDAPQESTPESGGFYTGIEFDGMSNPFNEVVTLLKDTQNRMNQLSECVIRYTEFLKTFQMFLTSLDLSVASVDITVASTAMNTLSQDVYLLDDLLTGYRNNSLTKRLLSIKFIEEVSSAVMLHANAAVSSLDSSVISEVNGIIESTERKIISAYTQLITYLSKLKTYLPPGSTVTDDFARNLSLWRRPRPMLQDKQVRSIR